MQLYRSQADELKTNGKGGGKALQGIYRHGSMKYEFSRYEVITRSAIYATERNTHINMATKVNAQ